ncbi:MAG: pyridoxal-phosphate dependent enzyme [Acidimicrobiales bacterium]
MIELLDVERAAARLAGVAQRTPVLRSDVVDARCGSEVFLKAECFQRSGSFKLRGAYNALSELLETTPAVRHTGVVTGSSGNHAAALALAGRLLQVPITVVMPQDAPANKRAATLGYGATVVDYDRYHEDRDQRCAEVAAQQGSAVIPAYDHPGVMAGQGTLALELFEQVPDLDVLVVCVGGGGLIAGCATVAKAQRRGAGAFDGDAVEVVGVEPAAGDDHVRSLAAGHRVSLAEVPRSIADGQLVTTPGQLTFEVNRQRVDRFVTVTDQEILHAMVCCFEQFKAVAEPSGASALAAVLSGAVDRPGARIGVTLSGGNIDLARFFALLDPHLLDPHLQDPHPQGPPPQVER